MFFFTIFKILDYWLHGIALLLQNIFSKENFFFWKKRNNFKKTLRKILDSLQKIYACCAQDNSCKRHAFSFRSTLFPPVQQTGKEIFPVGNISSRHITARNCIICKFLWKCRSRNTHFSQHFSETKRSFVRSFEDAPLLFATVLFTWLHNTCDMWQNMHTHMHTHFHRIHNTRTHAHTHTKTLKR